MGWHKGGGVWEGVWGNVCPAFYLCIQYPGSSPKSILASGDRITSAYITPAFSGADCWVRGGQTQARVGNGQKSSSRGRVWVRRCTWLLLCTRLAMLSSDTSVNVRPREHTHASMAWAVGEVPQGPERSCEPLLKASPPQRGGGGGSAVRPLRGQTICMGPTWGPKKNKK